MKRSFDKLALAFTIKINLRIKRLYFYIQIIVRKNFAEFFYSIFKKLVWISIISAIATRLRVNKIDIICNK
ncbi:hypothetical protein DVI68_27375 [Escherichia coli]|nr:hypothetical protein [Salmonella enterica]EEV6114678.1 hypothetical protein [Escherichia coli]EEV6210823.1 hypothetical protein [Escherichia coli]EEV8850935.1 hypothetical protein [Escherichia coli]EFN9639539.1 hypothetical protein [Escherichia coli]